jgi:hypothetical protein
MIAYLWLSLLGGIVLTLIGIWLMKYLTRFTAHIPEEVAMFLQPTNWEQIDIAFEPASFRQSYETELGHFLTSRDRILRRDLHSRIALGRQCLQRMTENIQAIECAAADDLRVAARWRKDLDSESSERSKAIAALQEAEKNFEREGSLPQDPAEQEEIFGLLVLFGPNADTDALLAEDAESRRELEKHVQRILATRKANHEFLALARWQRVKFDLLTALLRLDKLRLLPVQPIAALWEAGAQDILLLYKQARERAAAHARYYGQEREILART